MINIWVQTTSRGLVRADWIVGVERNSIGDLKLTTTSTEGDSRGAGPDVFTAAHKTPEGADRELVELLAVTGNHDVGGVIQLGKGRPTLEKFGRDPRK